MANRLLLKWILASLGVSIFASLLIIGLALTNEYESYSYRRTWQKKTWFGTQAVFRDESGIFSLRTIKGGVKPPFFLKEKQFVTPSESKNEHIRKGGSEYFYIENGKVVKSTQNFCVVESRENKTLRQSPCMDGMEQKSTSTVQYSEGKEGRSLASSDFNSYGVSKDSAADEWTFLSHKELKESLPRKVSGFVSSFSALHAEVILGERKLKLCKVVFQACPSLERGLQEARQVRAVAWDSFEPDSP